MRKKLNLIVICILLACFTSDFVLAQSKPVKIPPQIVQNLLKELGDLCSEHKGAAGRAALEKSIRAQVVDLNSDGIPEFIVRVIDTCFCGATGNCPAWVYQKSEKEYDFILQEMSATALYPKETSTKGYKDLVSEAHLAADEVYIREFKWDGTQYNPTICGLRKQVGERQGKPVYRFQRESCSDDNRPLAREVEPQRESPSVGTGPVSLSLVPNAFTIKASHYSWYEFNVSGQYRNAYVSGRFEVSGGQRNDVEVFILDPDAFTNWQNGHSVNTWYNSGRITVGNINVPLMPGKYFLVFNNNFSILSPKAISANINLIQRN